LLTGSRLKRLQEKEKKTTMRTISIFMTAAFLCCIGAQPARLPAWGLQSSAQTVEEPPEGCPVTKPPQPPFLPPLPYPSEGLVWIGSSKLWTNIPRSGTWRGLPHYTPEDTRFRQKLFWWSNGYDWRSENPPELTITGKRLDAPAPPLATDPHANAGWTNDRDHAFIVAGIFIPTLGCWKITGHYKGEELSYVVWVSR
jgi:hypothetical protein